MFTMTIDTSNAAFDQENLGEELASILADLGEHLRGLCDCESPHLYGEFPLMDINGNRVGTAKLTRSRK